MDGSSELKNRCYNCEKQFDPNRACISDGDCPEFEPVREDDLEKRMLDAILREGDKYYGIYGSV